MLMKLTGMTGFEFDLGPTYLDQTGQYNGLRFCITDIDLDKISQYDRF